MKIEMATLATSTHYIFADLCWSPSIAESNGESISNINLLEEILDSCTRAIFASFIPSSLLKSAQSPPLLCGSLAQLNRWYRSLDRWLTANANEIIISRLSHRGKLEGEPNNAPSGYEEAMSKEDMAPPRLHRGEGVELRYDEEDDCDSLDEDENLG